MDPTAENMVRPEWIELRRLDNPADMDVAAQRFFSLVQARRRRELKDLTYKVTRGEFLHQLGIDVEKYPGFYIEIGSCEAPEGPTIPSKKIRPILCIQRAQNSARYYVRKKKCKGMYSKDFSRAWIRVDDYEKMLDDTYFEELKKKAEAVEKSGVQKER